MLTQLPPLFFLKEIIISDLRKKWTRSDVKNAQILLFAREYHGEMFRFLTLTTKPGEEASMRDRRSYLFRSLRVFIPSLEYRCTRTSEGNGVCHVCLISPVFVPHQLIEQHWNGHIQISLERNRNALLKEMSLQSDHECYSMSRAFLPPGVLEAIESLGRLFRGRLGWIAIEMLARRWKAPDALNLTVQCCSRKLGWCSLVDSHVEILGGRNGSL